MASLNSEITFKDNFRPCYADGKKAIFHRWIKITRIIQDPNADKPKSLIVKFIAALCELENGQVKCFDPEEIRFADGGEFKEAIWR